MYLFQLKIAGCRSVYGASRHASSYYDAVIVGGGMVGNAMACSLGLNKSFATKSVLLLDSGKPPSLKAFEKGAPYKNRVVAISPTSVDIFKKLDIWDTMNAHRVKNVNRLYVFDSCSTSEIEFEREKQEEEVAYIIENELIVAALYDKLPDCKNVEMRTEAKVEQCSIPNTLENMATVKLANGDVIETSLLIGADGANSKVRRAANVGYTTFDYNQHGLVGTVDIQTPNGKNETGWQRFAKLGPVALLPLSDSVSALTWSTSPEEAQRLKNLPADQFVDELNNAMFSQDDQQPLVNQALFAFNRLNPLRWETFGRKADGTTPPHVISVRDNRGTFPLGFGSAHKYIAPRCALIGDAAHKMHPLAGQGVNLGWSDVQILDKILGDAVREGADIGSLTYLKEFDSAAQKHNLPVMVSVDLLNRLYRTDAPAIVAARAFGLNAFNSLGPIKNYLMNYLSAHR